MRQSRWIAEPFYHSDPPVAGSPNQEEPAAEAPAEESAPGLIEIDGHGYTEAELAGLGLGSLEQVEQARKDGQAQFTRETQAIADKKREVAEMETNAERQLAEAKALMDRAERFGTDDLPDETRVLDERLKPLEQGIQKITQSLEERQRVEEQQRATVERQSALDAAVNSLDGRPYINDATKVEIRDALVRGNLQPEHVGMVYNARFGAQIGEQRGLHQAQSQGINPGPPLSGAGQTNVSPGFTTPSEVPGVNPIDESSSWDDVSNAAMNDPEKPRF